MRGSTPAACSRSPMARFDRCAPGDGLATLSVRDRVQLLLECRRVLSARRIAAADGAGARGRRARALARWAALVGLSVRCSGRRAFAGLARAAAQPRGPGTARVHRDSVVQSALFRRVPRQRDRADLPAHRDRGERRLATPMRSARWCMRAAGRADIRLREQSRAPSDPGQLRAVPGLARGEYIKFLNDDDVLEADCVATLVECVRPRAGLDARDVHSPADRRRLAGHCRHAGDATRRRPRPASSAA